MTGDAKKAREALKAAISQRWGAALNPGIDAAAEDIAAHLGEGVAGVLFYGSCLRTGVIEDRILDFYVLVDDYKKIYGSPFLALANRLLPPNVFYRETPLAGGRVVRSKYAVISLDDFCRRCTDAVLNVSIWARFCQPAVLMRAKSPEVSERVLAAMIDAAGTMLRAALVAAGPEASSERLWSTAFSLTYAAELRSEIAEKGKEIYALDQAYYDVLTRPALIVMQIPVEGEGASAHTRYIPRASAIARARWRWRARKLNGKTVSFLRLVKAAFTFDGGIDYLAWKIRRHSGVEFEIKPWHRKHPILAGLIVFLPLRLKGAFK